MKRVMMAGIMVMLAVTLGCVPPQRISVRSDGVMAIPLKGKVYIYDPRSEKLTVVKPAGDLADGKLAWADWSPDGKRLLIGGVAKGRIEGQVGDANGTHFKKLLSLKDEFVGFAQWRPDGKAVSSEPSALAATTTSYGEVDVATGKEHLIMKNAFLFHRWLPDKGAVSLVTMSGDQRDVGDDEQTVGVVVSVQRDGHALALASIHAKIQPWLDVSPDGKTIILCAPKDDTPVLFVGKVADFATPSPRT